MSDKQRLPPRPAVPVAAYALAASVVAERQALGVGTPAWWPLAVLVVLALAALVGSLRGDGPRSRTAWLVGACLLVAAAAWLAATLCALSGQRFVDGASLGGMGRWVVEVLDDGTESYGAYRYRARAVREGGPEGCVWLTSSQELARGDRAQGLGPLEVDEGAWGRQSRQQGVWGSLRLVRLEAVWHRGGALGALDAWRERMLAQLGPDGAEWRSLVAGCVLADRRAMRTNGLQELFSSCGVAHLVAVSGSHLTVVGSLVAFVLSATKAPPWQRLGLVTVLTGAFVLLCGCPASAVRAWLMACVSAGSVMVGRRQDGLSSVCLVALAMALVDPAVVGQLSYLLSVMTVLALAAFSPYASYVLGLILPDLRLPRSLPAEARIACGKARDALVRTLAAGIVAQMASLPVASAAFGTLSPWGAVVSLVASLPFELTLASGALALCLCDVPVVGEASLALCSVPARMTVSIVRACASLPFASVPVGRMPAWAGIGVAGLAAAVYAFWPRLERWQVRVPAVAASCWLAALVLFWRFGSPPRVVILDVGQGDAILVQDGPHALLVDAGPDDVTAQALARVHVLRLDGVALSHLHKDHYGGLPAVMRATRCREVFVAHGVGEGLGRLVEEELASAPSFAVTELRYGDVQAVGGYELRLVWPRQPVSGTENEHSMELALSYQGRRGTLRMLLTGDAEHEVTSQVLAAGDVTQVDVLKLGHHGSRESITRDDLVALRPVLAIASAGEGNSYGHPSKECREVVKEAGAAFACTADDGDVEIRPGKDGVLLMMSRRRP